MVLYCIVEAWSLSLNQNDRLSLTVFAIVLVWIAGFALCYGTQSLRAAIFPLFFLLLMVPMPAEVLDKFVFALQKGSAEMTYALFKLFGVPVLWQGFKFSLPGVDIEIAKECSGIRASLALFITGMLAGHVFLQFALIALAILVPLLFLLQKSEIRSQSRLAVRFKSASEKRGNELSRLKSMLQGPRRPVREASKLPFGPIDRCPGSE
jgi:exosortase